MHMGFWLFMLVMALLVPGAMVVLGGIFLRNPPRTVNGVYGYRTRRSMASQAAWDFAHRTCGRLWRKAGLWMLPLSVLAMVPALGFSVGGVGLWGAVVVVVQTAAMAATIIPVERALKRNFDQFGHRITEKEPTSLE